MSDFYMLQTPTKSGLTAVLFELDTDKEYGGRFEIWNVFSERMNQERFLTDE